MAVRVAGSGLRLNRAGYERLTRSLGGPIGRDIQRRGLRVTRQMQQNASGRPGPQIRSQNLYNAIAFLRFAIDAGGIHADIGLQNHRMIRRGYNYALILEGLFPRGHAPPDGAYPFIARSLGAAAD
jgi:hypothetical protein